MKWFALVLAATLLLLQYRLWLSGAGLGEVLRLRGAVATQQADNERLSERNRELSAEVRDLKQGYTALEERARTDLGMVASNETFFQVLPGDAHAATPAQSAGAPPAGAPHAGAPPAGAPPATAPPAGAPAAAAPKRTAAVP